MSWHQDGEFWLVRSLGACMVCIAFDDMEKDKNTMRVILGSHRSTMLCDELEDYDKLT